MSGAGTTMGLAAMPTWTANPAVSKRSFLYASVSFLYNPLYYLHLISALPRITPSPQSRSYPQVPSPKAGLSLVFLSLISCFSSCYLLYQLQSSHISSSWRLFKKGRRQCTQRGCIGRTTCRIYLGRATTSSCGSPLPHSCCNTDDSFFFLFLFNSCTGPLEN